VSRGPLPQAAPPPFLSLPSPAATFCAQFCVTAERTCRLAAVSNSRKNVRRIRWMGWLMMRAEQATGRGQQERAGKQQSQGCVGGSGAPRTGKGGNAGARPQAGGAQGACPPSGQRPSG
jgi:hypothetical protein